MRTEGVSRFVTAPDGLRLHVRDYGGAGNGPAACLAVLCLPGLSRTAEDFAELAGVLAADVAAPRRVLALDYRGRGRSDHDRNPENYALPVELADVIAVVDALCAAPAVIIGTSRGGLLAMMLAAVRGDAVAGAVLNDIGPVIETAGLMRIKGYVGKLPEPASFAEGAAILRRVSGGQFPNLGPADWEAAARRGWREDGGRLVPTYDPALAHNLRALTPDTPAPTLWPQFAALARRPVMVVRGANSDVLSAATAAAMQARHPAVEVVTVPDQGHAPLLGPPIIERIGRFVRACDGAAGADARRSVAE